MKATFAQLKTSFMLIVALTSLLITGNAWAQNSTFEQEQAKLVGKFAKHIRWPDDARQTKFIIGVYGDAEKYKYFTDFFKDKGVNNKDVVVRLVDRMSRAKDVNILFISEQQGEMLESANEVLNGTNALIITENSKALHRSMIDISSNPEKTKIMFRINDARIDGTQLMIPNLSYFLDYDQNEKVLSASPTAIKTNQQSNQLLSLQKKVAEQDATINKLNKKLNTSVKNSKKYKQSLQKEVKRVKAAKQENAKKTSELKAKDKKLNQLERQIKQYKQSLQASDSDRAKEQAKAIAELEESLKKQKGLTKNAMNQLAKAKEAGEGSSGYQGLFYVFLVLTLAASGAAFVMWKKAQEAASAPVADTSNDNNELLEARNNQLINSENMAALGYVATDITYAVGESLTELLAQLESSGDSKHADELKPVVTLLDNFNLIAADQDDTDKQKFDVIAYMQKMMMLYDFEFSQSDIDYSYSGEQSLTINSVPSYIAIALLNVINNSLKHGFDNEGNGKIALKVEKQGNGAKITYSDDGKGMDKATVKQVTEPFFTTQSKRGYVGVGMSTTYDLIKNKLGGELNIDSTPGKGTTVTITLP